MLESQEFFDRQRTKAKARVAVCVYLSDGQNYLLQKRANTGLFDGMWDASASGGVENDSDPKSTAVTEAFEEIGVTIKSSDLIYISTAWIITERGENVILISFRVENWEGTPAIKEPKKCSGLCWFNLTSLPDNVIPDRKEALTRYNIFGPSYFVSDETKM